MCGRPYTFPSSSQGGPVSCSTSLWRRWLLPTGRGMAARQARPMRIHHRSGGDTGTPSHRRCEGSVRRRPDRRLVGSDPEVIVGSDGGPRRPWWAALPLEIPSDDLLTLRRIAVKAAVREWAESGNVPPELLFSTLVSRLLDASTVLGPGRPRWVFPAEFGIAVIRLVALVDDVLADGVRIQRGGATRNFPRLGKQERYAALTCQPSYELALVCVVRAAADPTGNKPVAGVGDRLESPLCATALATA